MLLKDAPEAFNRIVLAVVSQLFVPEQPLANCSCRHPRERERCLKFGIGLSLRLDDLLGLGPDQWNVVFRFLSSALRKTFRQRMPVRISFRPVETAL
jgi:hypothetical protein